MNQAPTLTPAERFALVIKSLRHGLSRRAEVKGIGALPGPLLLLIWTMLGRIALRFTWYAANPPPPSRTRRSAAKSKPRPSNPLALPRGKSWLMNLIPETAAGAGHLRHFLREPDVQSLLATNPQLRRILRPLCRMLHIHINLQTFQPVAAPLNKPPITPLAIPLMAPPQTPAAAILAAWLARARPFLALPLPTPRPRFSRLPHKTA